MGNPHTSLWINTSLQVNYFSTFRARVDPVVHCQLKVKVKVAQSSLTLLRPLYSPWNSSGQNTGLGSLSLLQGIFPTQGLNLGLPHCRQNFFTSCATREAKNTGEGSLSLLQWIFPTQKSNQGLLNCRWILYQLSYEGTSSVRTVYIYSVTLELI